MSLALITHVPFINEENEILMSYLTDPWAAFTRIGQNAFQKLIHLIFKTPLVSRYSHPHFPNEDVEVQRFTGLPMAT